MRRENSTFNLKFLSQPGVQLLHNNDYYGCSELEEFACYVVADGLLSGNDKREDPSARMAVEAVIDAFNASPSMGSRAISKYLEAAHNALRQNKGKKRCRASITVVITDYQKLRYGYAGNCRFHLYRHGKLIEESKDNSLSWEMMEEGQLPKDKIALHEERNNLDTYCGTMRTFRSTVSRKIKLRNADIFSLFTRGVWESADTNDMLSAVQVAENKPEEAADYLERLILDKTPITGIVENYTVCFVFIDKVYLDPKRGKRIKMIIIISLIVIVVVAVAVILFLWWRGRREEMRSNMQLAYHNGIEYIQGNNFVRAKGELETAYDLAEKLRDKKHKSDINNYKLLVDAVIYADDLMEAGNYETAIDAYGAASNQSRYADNLAAGYIDSKREKATGYLNVHEYIFLGDSMADIGDWNGAEDKYLSARVLASRMYYTDGKKEANDALTALYGLKEAEVQEQQAQAQAEVAAAEYIIEGDNALREGDLVAAVLFYQLARDQYEELGKESIVAAIDRKLALVDVKVLQNEYQAEYAADYIQAGDEMADQGEYVDAKRFYLLAREIYANLGDTVKLDEVQAKIDLVDLYLAAVPVGATSNADSEA